MGVRLAPSGGVPQAFNVVLMRGSTDSSAEVHVGVMINATRMLHVEETSHVVIVPVTHWTVASRILKGVGEYMTEVASAGGGPSDRR